VARRRDRPPEEYRRVLDLVHAEGVRLRQIVETLLFLAQPDVGQCEAHTVQPRGWVLDQVHRWSSHPRGADLCVQDEDGPLEARTHPQMLAQLLDDLLENASKYSEPGTSIVVRTPGDGRWAALGVEDRGCGLDAEDLSRVFEPFYRTERARSGGHPGIGLGLAVASRIAGSLGGTSLCRASPARAASSS
jgi:two-component system, OmpR family, sensor kinase